jgi:hypothetical protein
VKPRRVVLGRGYRASFVAFPYRYELRRGEAVLATGHISFETPLEVGERVTIGSSLGLVQSVTPTLQDRELQLVVQLLPDTEGP